MKLAICHTHLYLRFYKTFSPSSHVLEEDLYSHVTGIWTTPNNHLYELASDVSQNLISGGIMQHFIDLSFYVFCKRISAIQIMEDSSLVIVLDDLSYGFILWIIACLISYVGFMFELTTFYLKIQPIEFLKNMIGLNGLLNILFAHYRN